MKPRTVMIMHIVEIIVLVFVILSVTAVVYYARTNGAKCMSSPLTFGLKEYSKINNYDISCRCQVGENAILLVNQTDMALESTLANDYVPNFELYNFSLG